MNSSSFPLSESGRPEIEVSSGTGEPLGEIRQCCRLYSYLSQDPLVTEHGQIMQALSDLHEIYPDWQFAACARESILVIEEPNRRVAYEQGFKKLVLQSI